MHNPLLLLLLLFHLRLSFAQPRKPSQVLTLSGTSSTFRIHVYGLTPQDNSHTPAIRHAFRHLADVWPSPIPVLCRVTFTDLGGPDSLASGGGVLFMRFDRSPDRELIPIAAAEAIVGRELNEDETGSDAYDILIKINTASPWHLDLTTIPPIESYDLATVLLHEALHNLLFSGAVSVSSGSRNLPEARLLDGFPARFDLFLSNEQGCAVLDYLRDYKLANFTGRSTAELLAQAVTNNRLFFHDDSSGLHVPLYAPRMYQSKSSLYHVDTRRGATARVMNQYIPSGFMERYVNDELRAMQKAFLDPSRRGARHCKLPLSDPATRTGVDEDVPFEAGSGGVPIWAVAVSGCSAAAISIVAFFVCSHIISKRATKGAPISRSIRRRGSKWDDKRFSSASSDLLVEESISYDDVEIDVRDLEIDEDDFRLFDYREEDRYTEDRQAQYC